MTSSGDTIASLAFNDKMSWDKNEDTLNYSDTFTSLGNTVMQNHYDPNDERPI